MRQPVAPTNEVHTMGSSHSGQPSLTPPRLLIIGGALLVLVGCLDVYRRHTIWKDTRATTGVKVRANHMSLGPGTIVYADENGRRRSFPAPYLFGPKEGQRVRVEFRRSDSSRGWFSKPPPSRRIIPAMMIFLGMELILISVVLFARAGRISSMPVSWNTLTGIVIAASVLMAFGSILWCRSAPKVISATAIAPDENQQGAAADPVPLSRRAD
jgi:hypothetical protein